MKKGSCDSAVVTSSDKSDLLYNHIPHPTRMANSHMSAWIAFAARRCCSLSDFGLPSSLPGPFFHNACQMNALRPTSHKPPLPGHDPSAFSHIPHGQPVFSQISSYHGSHLNSSDQ